MNAFTFPIPRGTSLGLRPIEDVMMVGAHIPPNVIYAEVARVIDRHGPGHPPTGMLQLALENLLREKIRALEARAEVAESRVDSALKYADDLWPESLEDAVPRNPVDSNNKFLADHIRRALKVES